ncbi:N-acetylmuramidase family protein [Kluyvera ascorbata]|uniref:N-acetylmuramidase family protein n=1 Tax=Kluyvera ascorbata TaxID=51288 RepID=UPI0022E19BDE|nr:N-acetylmuramidase family protein [Kluyvera ascorbata]HDG1678399.1 N-acetylmuramidase family protein [Kluyvera ascorbata]
MMLDEESASLDHGSNREKIGWKEIVAAAKRLQIEPCALQAVCAVESSGQGFLPSGKPKILFEGHIFWRELAKRRYQPEILAASFPTILYRQWTAMHYLGGEKEHARLETAMSLHREAALCSTSWGAFQIMGFNFALCGFRSVEDFVTAQSRGSHEQLEALCQLMVANNLHLYLQNKDWVSFARRYNGPGYAQNHYDIKMANAYQQCLRIQQAS